jgi:hypothetical protein
VAGDRDLDLCRQQPAACRLVHQAAVARHGEFLGQPVGFTGAA